jgi:hypothetical protein
MESLQEFLVKLGDPMELTRNAQQAERAWGDVSRRLAHAGRSDVLGNPRLLELGCRRGVLLDWLHGAGISAVGIDVCDPPPARPGITILQADAHALPFQGEPQFNLVYSFGIYDPREYTFDFGQILDEVHRVTVPDAVYYIQGAKQPDLTIASDHGFNVLETFDPQFWNVLERV